MAATFGAEVLPAGVTIPTDCAVQSCDEKESVEKSTYRGGDGITAGVISHKLVTREVTLEVVGKPPLTGVVAGAFAEGTLKQISAKFTENVDGPPSGSVTYKSDSSVGGGD